MSNPAPTPRIPLWHRFSPSARLFLTATLVDGIISSAWILFFNLYILAKGYPREFLGVINATASIATLVLGIPLGMLSDRIGRRRAMMLGVLAFSVGQGLQLLMDNTTSLLIWGFLAGVGYTLWMVSQAPYMMAVAEGHDRTLLFSLNFGMVTLAGAVGNVFAGQLPALMGSWLGFAADSAEAYQAVLMGAVLLGTAALIPLYFMREKVVVRTSERKAPPWRLFRAPVTWKLLFPNVLVGAGAGLVVPYLNVFFVERFKMPDGTLGVLFALSALLTGIGSVWGPRLARQYGGKVRTVVITQTVSLVFIVVLGFSPWVAVAAVGFLLRNMFMNMATPLLNAFSMEQYSPEEQGMANGLINIGWVGAWSISLMISGVVQARYGFTPLFISMAILYAASILVTWLFFSETEEKQQAASSADTVSA